MLPRAAWVGWVLIALCALSFGGCEDITGVNDFTTAKPSDGGNGGEASPDGAGNDAAQDDAVGDAGSTPNDALAAESSD